jgi:hypothetical protein
LKKKISAENSTEQIQKREKLVSGFIIVIAIIIGVLITFLLTGLLDFFAKK